MNKFLAIGCLAILSVSFGCMAQLPSNSSSSQPQLQDKVGTNSGVTLDRYNQVKTGMSISKVETIIGEGQELSRAEMAGVPLTISYMWQNSDGSNMTAVFQGNKLISKAQALLK